VPLQFIDDGGAHLVAHREDCGEAGFLLEEFVDAGCATFGEDGQSYKKCLAPRNFCNSQDAARCPRTGLECFHESR
jgi:hypothetical protein